MKKSTAHVGVSQPPSESSFFQSGPRLGNLFEEDLFLQSVLERLVGSPELLSQAKAELDRLGDRGVYDMLPKAKQLDLEQNQPKLNQYDAWGRRVDEIVTHSSWQYMHTVAAEEGVISDGYNTLRWGRDARLVQYCKLYLYAPVSGLYSCPLAMTDGAARFLINLQSETTTVGNNRGEIGELIDRLLSNDPAKFITSGQWMTERAGGSDVGQGTETIARKQPDGTYKLFGYKWFTSATDAHMSLALARIEDENGQVELGSNGLSCFLVKLRDNETGALNSIRVHRMKDKFGTKQLPTAEMELLGTTAILVSQAGRGIPAITAGMVNITRLHNAISACAAMRLITALGRDYSHRRMVFGALLADNELHLKTLAQMELNTRASLVLTLDAVSVLGRVETASPNASKSELLGGSSVAGTVLTLYQASLLVRLLTPLAKMFTGKLAVATVSEGLELFGGQGYMESSGLPRIYRDAQVLPIWEGTTNVLAHDVLRVLTKSKFEALEVFSSLVLARCQAAGNTPQLQPAVAALKSSLTELKRFLQDLTGLEPNAREFALSLSRIAAGSCLLEHAVFAQGGGVDAQVAVRWCCNQSLVSISPLPAKSETELDRVLGLNLDSQGQPSGFGDRSRVTGKARAKF
ncbi:hypothetical protein BASA81_000478 [Batrachochytrium salamandrivorans]|nr:hypothetical protein BASA81_000478 [Batrachochytrium salamandrivorans]